MINISFLIRVNEVFKLCEKSSELASAIAEQN